MTPFFTKFATEEFTRRRAVLQKERDAGRIDPDAANRTATLWLAIACAAGADLPELQVARIWPPNTTGRMIPQQIAEAKEWRAELTRARDVAVRKSLANPKDLHAQQRAWDMQALAVALGCPETTLIKEERNAA